MYRRLAAISWAGFIGAVILGCLTSMWRTWVMVAVACAGCGVVLSTMSSVGHWIEIGMMVALVAVGLWLIWAERGFSVVDFVKSARGVHDDE
jgi:threonine/homoserine efflux transporter RhtA